MGAYDQRVSRPVIGICAAVEVATYGAWTEPVAFSPAAYPEAVRAGGGLALLVPPDPRLEEDPDEVLDLLDGLILAGGADIDPAAYGAERDPATVSTTPERDAAELALARRALERDLPLLGICRGMQLLNVACGGTLVQHLPDGLGHDEHRRVLGSWLGNEHDVVLDEGSAAARLAGETRHRTYSHHHQAVDRLGDGLRITGRSPADAVPEAIERADGTLAVGVQWHPEVDPDSRVIARFVAEAVAVRDARRG